MAKQNDTMIVDGIAYVKRPDGSLKPVHDDKVHAQQMLDGITKDHGIQGLRIANLKDLEAEAVNVRFSPAEATKVLALVKDLLKVRAA